MNPKSLSVTVLLLLAPLLHGEEKVFQNGKDDYEGYRQAVLRGHHEVERTLDGTRRSVLKIVGVPHGGQRSMAIIGFGDLFNPAKGGLSPGQSITSARLELFKVGEDADPYLFDRTSDWDRLISIHLMLTPFYDNQDMGGYSCFSYRRFGGGNEDLYWGTKHQLTDGPVRGIDYEEEPIAKIKLEPGTNETWYSVDITQALQRALEAGQQADFFLIARTYWLGLHFASGMHDNPELRPRLIVEY